MPALEPLKRVLMDRLDAVLDGDPFLRGKFRKHIENGFPSAVWPRSHGQTHDARLLQGLAPDRAQPVDWAVRVGGGLKVGDQNARPPRPVPAYQALSAIGDLPGNGSAGGVLPPTRAEAADITEKTALATQGAVHIRAAQSCVDADFPGRMSEPEAEEKAQRIVAEALDHPLGWFVGAEGVRRS